MCSPLKGIVVSGPKFVKPNCLVVFMRELKHRIHPFPAHIAFIFLLLLILSLPLYAQNSKLAAGNYWIFFESKDFSTAIEPAVQAVARRMVRAGVVGHPECDYPVNTEFIEGIRSSGATIRVVSRWLNAVSAEMDELTLAKIRGLDYVSGISPVSSYSMPVPQLTEPLPFWLPKPTVLDYGPSLGQIAMLNIDSLHNAGLSGKDILIGMMDTGFDTTHEVFTYMDSSHHVVAPRTFIDGGTDVMGPVDIQRSHGTATLSTIGGYHPGDLIGPAYGASFVLARTEIVTQEIQAEEDYWVAASEWMESLGVDIISSSLGYIDWYDTTQLDGKTALITRAANVADSLGIIVVNSAGNEGTSPWRKIIPPADGFQVIAAGGVDINGLVADFSSKGPTADGRIKPDFSALAVNDHIAVYTGGYAGSTGTSFSAPLLAGGIALLLEGYPQWTLVDVISRLKRASSMSNAPNNDIGWGIPNFVDAYYSEAFIPGQQTLLITPQPAIDSVIFNMTFRGAVSATLTVHELSGAKIQEWKFAVDKPSTIAKIWDGRNASGERIASGIYICVLKTGGDEIREKFAYISR